MSFAEGWKAFAEEAGPLLVQELTAQAPYVTGALAESMNWQLLDDQLQAYSDDPRGPIGAYVVRGTRPHSIDPVNARMLHFWVDGNEVFAHHVDHPGTAPNRFHLRAWEELREEVLGLFAKRVGDAVLVQLNPWREQQTTLTIGSD